jgi:hypothetical protein
MGMPIPESKLWNTPKCLIFLLMLLTTHIAVTIFFCLFLNLDRNEWFMAFVFGVMLDIDHLFGLEGYVSRNGWGAVLHQSWDDGSGMPWKSLLQRPVGAFVVVPLAAGWRYLIPLTFWTMHMGMDWLQLNTGYLSTGIEAAVFAASCLGTVALLHRNWSVAEPEGDIRDFLSMMWSGLVAYGSSLRRRVGSIV